MRTFYVYLVVLFSFMLGGCFLFDGGMNTVEPPSYEDPSLKQESILNDLSPVRARDIMISEREEQQQKQKQD